MVGALKHLFKCLHTKKIVGYIYYMKDDESSLLSKIKDAFDALDPSDTSSEYPKEAMKPGTFVRASRLNKLGIITDAFYEGKDKTGKKIITYSILLLPKKKPFSSNLTSTIHDDNLRYYVTNEYEYDVIGYLMMSPVDMSKMNIFFEGSLF